MIHRYLDPDESLGELLFGLIMTLTVTLGVHLLSPEQLSRPQDLAMALVGCNVAWGIIDAALYLLGSVFARNQRVHFMRKLRAMPSEARALQAIREEYGLDDAHLAPAQDLAAFYRAALDVLRYAKVERTRLRDKDWLAALMIVLLVAVTAVPGAVPILLVGDPVLAVRLANLMQIGLLFAVGYRWARVSGANPWRTGAAIVGFAVVLVVISIALGG
ncbi:MAG: VIT1/CCC1 transporter family protein [Proteobacteria bacterium]|nr:VIT1/CCC1 transporter family protein [Pseudomonadota bacterium]